MKNVLTGVVTIILIYFGAYSIAPVLGLDELLPQFLGDQNRLAGLLLVCLMLLGGFYWRGFWINSRKRRRRERD